MLQSTALAFNDASAKNVGFDISAFKGQFQGIKKTGGLIDTIIFIINALLVLAAIAAIVYIIIAGVRYIVSQGDEDSVAQAKRGILYAIIGIIVILLAAVLVNFVLVQII